MLLLQRGLVRKRGSAPRPGLYKNPALLLSYFRLVRVENFAISTSWAQATRAASAPHSVKLVLDKSFDLLSSGYQPGALPLS